MPSCIFEQSEYLIRTAVSLFAGLPILVQVAIWVGLTFYGGKFLIRRLGK